MRHAPSSNARCQGSERRCAPPVYRRHQWQCCPAPFAAHGEKRSSSIFLAARQVSASAWRSCCPSYRTRRRSCWAGDIDRESGRAVLAHLPFHSSAPPLGALGGTRLATRERGVVANRGGRSVLGGLSTRGRSR